MNLSDQTKEILTVEGWDAWVGQWQVSNDMISEQGGMVQAGPELVMTSFLKEGLDQACMNTKLYLYCYYSNDPANCYN